jgi:DNA-binding NtrC family response regulator
MNHDLKKILLVDDEEVVLFGYQKVLGESWLQVDTASTLQEAKELVQKNTYAAAIVDIRLSTSTGNEGLDLVPYIKEHQNECRIIVITAYGGDTIRARALESGALLFLEKPMEPDTLKKELAALGID